MMADVNKKHFDDFLEKRVGDMGSAIHDLWSARDESVWAQEPYFYLRLGETANKLGQPMFAHDILKEGLDHFPDHLRLKQLFSLSLIQCGFFHKAQGLLSDLVAKGHHDEETLGILGRVYKEMWLITDDVKHLRQSKHLYLKAFEHNRGNYSGINAASLSFILGEREAAEKLAHQVIKICFRLLPSDKNPDYWVIATLGEAYILLGKSEEAGRYYRQAKNLMGNRFSELASTRRQLKILSLYTNLAADMLETLVLPPIVAFTGHMIDSPDRRTPRFPPSIAPEVKKRIDSVLNERDVAIGYASAACGSDILFLECLQSRGGETNIILPFDRSDFITTCVQNGEIDWISRFDNVLEAATQVIQATRGDYGGDDLLFSYANRIIMGQAILRSRLLETEPLLIAVWDGQQNSKTGGTAEFVRFWEQNTFSTRIIDPSTIPGKEVVASPAMAQEPVKRTPRPKAIQRETVSILFADLVGFSRLEENQIPHYVYGFLGTLSAKLRRSSYQPEFKNLWGDSLLFVFKNHLAAAEYALELRDLIRETDWQNLNLPNDLNIRIGLHVGPVYTGKEPLLGRWNLFGTHVNQAARIEPITSPGNVYASDAFAALLSADMNNRLDCRYVGEIVLPKDFGRYPIYHIKRKTEIE